jgi:3-phenylpropionate/trans-cinnamate dioxygenase ferredoxin subunit
MTAKAIRVCSVDEIADGRVKLFKVDGHEGLVVRSGDAFFACDRYCTHEKFPLEFGRLKDGHKLCCTYHGAEFDLKTGEALTLPARKPLAIYKVRVEGKDLLVEIPAA